MFTALLFSQGVDLCAQIFHRQGHPPSTTLGVRQLETYSVMMIASFCVTSFWHNLECDGRTDGQTDGRIWSSICSACEAI